MRDILVVGIVLFAALIALRRPWIGVLLWTWLSIMNPHRYAFGFAYDFPVAMIAAASTMVGFLITPDKQSPFGKGSPPIWLMLFMLWMSLSLVMGLDPGGDYPQWNKVMKILFMVIVSLMVIRTKEQIFALALVVTASLALLGMKGGLFTILNGGSYKVWGPPESFIEENNSLALAMVMTIPLVRFFQTQVRHRWGKHALTVSMLLIAAAALGSHSRGALLAIGGMVMLLWYRSGRNIGAGVLIAVAAVAMMTLMPDEWSDRMSTIETYEEDASAMSRISAWWTAWGIGTHHLFGTGFHAARAELFLLYSPYGTTFGMPAAHSIYFQIMGHHGLIGLALWLGIWISTWRLAGRIRKLAPAHAETRWCLELANMIQVSLAGYAIGGAFLSLAYFDLPYNLMALTALTYAWMQRKAWLTERQPLRPRWLRLPGVEPSPKRAS